MQFFERLSRRVNEANFGWRALRLLARRSLHFFTHGNTPITRLPDYLETHVRKLAKEIQVQETGLKFVFVFFFFFFDFVKFFLLRYMDFKTWCNFT